MRQLVQDLRSGAVEVLDLPDPRPGHGEVLVRNTWSLISAGTEGALARTASKSLIGKARDRPDQAKKVVDKALKDGIKPTLAAVGARLDDLMTPGYSSSGVVEAVGPGVTGLEVGQRVGCVGANVACHAERVAIPAPLCIPLPGDLDPRWGSFGALGAIAAHGVRLAGVEAGGVVAVIGLGLVGQLATQLVTAAGGRAIGIDPVAATVELARRLGASGGAVLGSDDVEAVVAEASGGEGADTVVICAATKDSGPLELAAEIARDRAVVCAVGDVGLDVPRAPFYEKELGLRISRSYGPGRYDDSYEREGRDYPIGYVRWTERRLISYLFEEIARGRIALDDLVTHEFTIDKGVDAYEAMNEPGRMAILLRYPEASTNGELRRRAPIAAPAAPAAASAGRLRLALIGPGLFARSTLLPAIKDRDDVELAGIAGRSAARAFGVGRRAGASFVTTDPAEVLSDESIDAVVVATQHDSHAGMAVRAMEAGKPVFLEKPLAIDEEGLRSVESALGGAGGRLVVDFNRSLAPATREVLAALSGRSEPIHVSCRVNAGYLDPDHWLRDPAKGGGRLVGEGCHFVDLCSALVGSPMESVQVNSLGVAPRTLAGDNFVLTLRYADGSVGTVTYVSSGHPGMHKELVEVIGAGRAATIDDFRKADVHAPGRKGKLGLPSLGLGQDKGHAAILDASFRFFRGQGEAPIPYERLVETSRATLVARAAMEEGRTDPQPLGAA